MLPQQSVTPTRSLGEWVRNTEILLRDRRAEPFEGAALLLMTGVEWNPASEPLSVANRVAETARASLPLASAMMHHCEAAHMLSLAGCPTAKGEHLAWSLSGSALSLSPGRSPSVSGQANSCCTPPDQRVSFVTLTGEPRHVVSILAEESDDARHLGAPESNEEPAKARVRVDPDQHGASVVEFDTAAVEVHGRCTSEMLVRASTARDLLEAAAWYGALTRLADGLVSPHGAEPPDEGRDLALAEADALLGATWATIREASLVSRQGNGIDLTRHHTARARTLARTAAATILGALVPGEFMRAGRDPGVVETRAHLVSWMDQSGWSRDIDLIAGSVHREGPSW